ncbi:DNA primase [Streptomyces sp. NPDC001307]|uniref:DNA primase n=1 Tax=Streptomyces sp. NPDC001307 TaxID=3364560 RepID=UPI0036A3EA56
MNRTALGLAIGAGYLLGRTKKLKMAVAVGSLVAGKKLNLSPKMLADVVSQQLKNNPQFKEMGDQLRQDLRGVGKAASGAMVERQMNSLADRLHGRTSQVREQLSGVVPGGSAATEEREDQEDEDAHEESAAEEGAGEESEDRAGKDRAESERGSEPRGRKPGKKAPAKKAPVKKAAAKKAAPAKKAAARKTDATRRTAGKRTAAASGQRKGDDR